MSGRARDGRSHIYFIRAEVCGLIKVGHSALPKSRVSTLQALSPVKLEIIARARGGAAVENVLHERLKEWRSHSEWHFPVPPVLAVVDEARRRRVLAGTEGALALDDSPLDSLPSALPDLLARHAIPQGDLLAFLGIQRQAFDKGVMVRVPRGRVGRLMAFFNSRGIRIEPADLVAWPQREAA